MPATISAMPANSEAPSGSCRITAEHSSPKTGTPSKPIDVTPAGNDRFTLTAAQYATAMPKTPP
ncbi:hypothetical protein D3C87_2201970 [compost metagenome]